jgi:uncharacterized protein with PIN domain
MIEALGVPHTEVEMILVNGASVGLSVLLCEGDRVAVYPKFEAFDVTPLLRVREQPLRQTRFLADVHLGSLAHMLRMLGFDTLYDKGFVDDEIARIAAAQKRIVLTRDRDLLKRRSITHGCYVHALRPQQQLREVFERLQLARSARPFTLCPVCNAALRAAAKAQVEHRLPPGVRDLYHRFSTCEVCDRVLWEGQHWQRLGALLDAQQSAL